MTQMDAEQAKFAGQLVWPGVTIEHTIVVDVSDSEKQFVYMPDLVGGTWITFDMKPMPGYTRFSEMGYDRKFDMLAVRLN